MTTKRMARLSKIRIELFLLGICYRLRNPAGDRSQSAGIYAQYKACGPHQPILPKPTAVAAILLRVFLTMDSTGSPESKTPDPTSYVCTVFDLDR